jgi:hypothetical protein
MASALCMAMTHTNSTSDDERELQEGLSALRTQMADFRKSIRQIQAEMHQSQEEHFKKMKLSFNFKDPEYPDGIMDGSSGNANHSFQTNSSTESSHNQYKSLNSSSFFLITYLLFIVTSFPFFLSFPSF